MKEDPILLILDNRASHIGLQVIDFCREKGIIMVSIPPHCTHRLQPLDISFFGPLKTYYSRSCDAWMAHHPGQAITEYHVASLVNGAYQKAATVASAVSGFHASGIYPFDRDVFSDADFSAALTTDRALETNQPNGCGCPPISVCRDECPLTANPEPAGAAVPTVDKALLSIPLTAKLGTTASGPAVCTDETPLTANPESAGAAVPTADTALLSTPLKAKSGTTAPGRIFTIPNRLVI